MIAENDLAVLSDFSAAHICGQNTGGIRRTIGTPAFASPESFAEKPFDPIKADIWSLGVSLFVMLFGRHPFSVRLDDRLSIVGRFMELVDAIQNEVLQFDGVEISEELQELLLKLLDRDPDKRPTTEEILECDWVKGGAGGNEEIRFMVPRSVSNENENQNEEFETVKLSAE